jgi:hypothetical protein
VVITAVESSTDFVTPPFERERANGHDVAVAYTRAGQQPVDAECS